MRNWALMVALLACGSWALMVALAHDMLTHHYYGQSKAQVQLPVPVFKIKGKHHFI